MRRCWVPCLLLLFLCHALSSCGGAGGGNGDMLTTPSFNAVVPLTPAEVQTVIQQAVAAIDDPNLVVAVVDRIGNILGVYSNANPSNPDNDNLAVSLARSSAFFSNSQAPLTSRTTQFISGPHFPPVFGFPFLPSVCPTSGIPACPNTVIAPRFSTPGVNGTPQGPLWQINATNRGAPLADPAGTPPPGLTPLYPTNFITGQAIPPATNINGTSPSPGITRLPGGVPLYKPGVGAQPGDLPRPVGGVGVWIPGATGPETKAMEYAAWTGSDGFRFPPVVPFSGAIFLNGLLLPYVDFPTIPAGFQAGAFGAGIFVVAPAPGQVDPFGMLIAPRDSFAPGGLTATQVNGIISRSINWAQGTRAAIRLPLGSQAKMCIAVTDLDGYILGLFRMEDATIFSIDVAVAKARCVTYLSSPGVDPADQIPGVPPGTAVTTRTLGFLSQPFYPPGIQTSGQVGPLFNMAIQNQFPVQADRMANAPLQPGRQSGVIFFPGATPLYDSAGNLVGGLGISGDGVEQDDFVTFGGSQGFLPPPAMRADAFSFSGLQLPYFKFPQNPGPGGN